MKFISIVVPVYNEADNLRHFSSAIHQAMAPLPYQYQLLFINDGSTDNSLSLLQQLQAKDEHIHYISLSRNFGHQAALTCGLDQADGDAIITMDGDMQHPPALLPRLLHEWEHGADIVQTIRESTEGVSVFKRLTSRFYYRLLNVLSDVPIQPGGSDFRLMDRRAVEALKHYREQARFIRGIVGSLGFRQVKINFTAPPRFAGTSKFSLHKMITFALNGILANSIIPLRLSFYGGCLSACISLLLLAHVFVAYWLDDAVPGWATIMVCLSFFGGIQLMMLGIVGEYIGRIFAEVKGRPLYLIGQDSRIQHANTNQGGIMHEADHPECR